MWEVMKKGLELCILTGKMKQFVKMENINK